MRRAISIVVENRLYERALRLVAGAPEPQHYLLAGFVGQLVGVRVPDVLQDIATTKAIDDACRDTPETCGFCGGPLSAPEDGRRCSKRCR